MSDTAAYPGVCVLSCVQVHSAIMDAANASAGSVALRASLPYAFVGYVSIVLYQLEFTMYLSRGIRCCAGGAQLAGIFSLSGCL